ncbi:MAG: pyridoxal-phosphate dependent enzyme [Desulfobacterales bacterium]|nr:pyridoxal-phosphate dependent enzyme [Desulfobacterales bacterium]
MAGHRRGTAPEIWSQTGGAVKAVMVGPGAGGTTMGISEGIKAFDPDVRIIGVGRRAGHAIQGLKNMKASQLPGIFDKHRLDR